MNIKNIAVSVRDRLKNQARAEGKPFNEILTYFAMERFLYRLARSPHTDRFILKGGFMLRVWTEARSRATRDLDMLGRTDNDIEKLEVLIKDILSVDVEDDGVVFDLDTITSSAITEDSDYPGVRFKFQGKLGTTRLPVQIDIGFGDVVSPEPVQMKIPTFLEMPEIVLRCYNRETAIAEKFQAMTLLGMNNGRIRDFYDIWLLSSQFNFSGEDLSQAIQNTFKRRGAEIDLNPDSFSEDFIKDKQTDWKRFRDRQSGDAEAPEALGDVVAAIVRFLEPVAKAVSDGAPYKGTWEAGKGWRK